MKNLHKAESDEGGNGPAPTAITTTECEHKNQETGFGLAGGGYGVYMFCVDCGFITSKTQTD